MGSQMTMPKESDDRRTPTKKESRSDEGLEPDAISPSKSQMLSISYDRESRVEEDSGEEGLNKIKERNHQWKVKRKDRCGCDRG